MAEAPEIPEANSDDDKKVALTIAILAVVLSFVGNLGDNAKTDAVIKTNEASNQWGYFQSKSIKGSMSAMHSSLLSSLGKPDANEEVLKKVEKLKADAERYDKEKDEIKKLAEGLVAEAGVKGRINDRCDLSSLLMQISVVLCSVSILASQRIFWYIGMALGALGAIAGVTAFFI